MDREDTFAVTGGHIRIIWPGELNPADLPDVRDWFALISRRLERIEQRAASTCLPPQTDDVDVPHN